MCDKTISIGVYWNLDGTNLYTFSFTKEYKFPELTTGNELTKHVIKITRIYKPLEEYVIVKGRPLGGCCYFNLKLIMNHHIRKTILSRAYLQLMNKSHFVLYSCIDTHTTVYTLAY